MRHPVSFCIIFCLAVLLTGCEPSKEDRAVKTSTDYAKEAVQRVKERGDCRYSADDYQNSAHSFSFRYPENWSVPADLQMPEVAVVAVRSEPVDGFTANMCVVISNDKPAFSMIGKSFLQRQLRDEIPDATIVDLERGKFNDNDALYFRSRGTTEGIKIEQRQYHFVCNGKYYNVTFTTSQTNSDQIAKDFDAILAAFKAGPGYDGETRE